MKVIIVLPAYNEAANLPALLEGIERMAVESGFEVLTVVVDDGSADGTWDAIKECASTIRDEYALRHGYNCGLGLTIRDGLLRAGELANSEDVIITMDADGTHDPDLIPTMVRATGHSDIVIASRYRRHSEVVGLSPIRRLMSFGARLLFQTLMPIPGVRDYTCGYRAYRASIVHRALQVHGEGLVRERGFSCMAEILLKMERLNATVCEVPMTLRYDRKQGESKMRVWRTVAHTMSLLMRARIGVLP